jgi:hypothetical protein
MPVLPYHAATTFRSPRTVTRCLLFAATPSVILGCMGFSIFFNPGYRFVFPLSYRELFDQRIFLFYFAQFLLGIIYLSSLHGIRTLNRRNLWQTLLLTPPHATVNLLVLADECHNLFGPLPRGLVHDPPPSTFWIIGPWLLLLTIALAIAAITTFHLLLTATQPRIET